MNSLILIIECLCSYYVFILIVNMIANQVKIASLRGIEAIIKAMSTHNDHSGVQEQACGALSNLAVNDDGMVSISM